MVVEIWRRNNDANEERAGIVTQQDGKLSGDTKQAKKIAQTPIMLRDGMLKPGDDPERFVRSLHLAYHGSRMWAMKAATLIFVLLAIALTTATAQTPEPNLQADLALAAVRLAAATERPEPCSWQYVRNSDLPPDAIELAPEEQVQPERFYQAPPIERPQGVPDDFVPVRVFQSREDEGWKFWGWILLPLKNVRELHENLATI